MRSCEFDRDATRQGVAYLRILFPEPAINPQVVSESQGQTVMGYIRFP